MIAPVNPVRPTRHLLRHVLDVRQVASREFATMGLDLVTSWRDVGSALGSSLGRCVVPSLAAPIDPHRLDRQWPQGRSLRQPRFP